MADMKKVAKHMIRMEAVRDGVLDEQSAGVATWWADLVVTLIDELPPATAPRIAELIVDYVTDGDDG